MIAALDRPVLRRADLEAFDAQPIVHGVSADCQVGRVPG
jgi:hypothetical protein